MESKIKTVNTLSGILKRLKSKNRKIVFTNGCFDILHLGHVKYLKKARSMGDALVVGLNSDRSVRAIKGKSRPINSEDSRAKILAALYFVDYVTIFDESTPEKLIRRVRPDILVKGSDWKPKDIAGAEFVKSYGGRVATVKLVKGFSTTSLIRKACCGH